MSVMIVSSLVESESMLIVCRRDDIWARAAENPLCKHQESRSIYRLFTEGDGRLLGETKIE